LSLRSLSDLGNPARSTYPQLAVLRPILTGFFVLVTIGAGKFRANWIYDWRIMEIESRA
jgi:hypothetical protein